MEGRAAPGPGGQSPSLAAWRRAALPNGPRWQNNTRFSDTGIQM